MSHRRIAPIVAALAGAAFLFASPSLEASSHSSGGHSSGGHSSSHSSGHMSSHGSSHFRSSQGFRSGGFRSGGHFRSFGRFGFGGGWWWWPWWGWGYPYYYYDGYYGYPGYGYYAGYGDGRGRFAAVKTDVEPDEAALYLDGKLIGTADDFDGYPDMLYLGPGHYRLEFRLDGYETLTTNIDAAPGRFFRVDKRLKKIPGARHYGTYTPAKPEGGIVRYFEKRHPPAAASDEDSQWRGPDRDGRYQAGEDEPSAPEMSGEEAQEPPDADDDDAYADEGGDQPAAAAPSLGDARIVFDVSPPEAAVYIDDRFAGSARELDGIRGGLAVPSGEHRITVTCPGYREATLRVTASTSDRASARIDLKK